MTVHVPIEAHQHERNPSPRSIHTFQRRVNGVFFRGHPRDGVCLKDLRWFVAFLGLEFRPLVCEGEGWFSAEGE